LLRAALLERIARPAIRAGLVRAFDRTVPFQVRNGPGAATGRLPSPARHRGFDSPFPQNADSNRASPIRAGFVFALARFAPDGTRHPAGNLRLIRVGSARLRLDSAAGGG